MGTYVGKQEPGKDEASRAAWFIEEKRVCVRCDRRHYWRFLKLPLSLPLCLSVRPVVTEVKREPIKHEHPADYEETLLEKRRPSSKVSILFCIEMFAYNTLVHQ